MILSFRMGWNLDDSTYLIICTKFPMFYEIKYDIFVKKKSINNRFKQPCIAIILNIHFSTWYRWSNLTNPIPFPFSIISKKSIPSNTPSLIFATVTGRCDLYFPLVDPNAGNGDPSACCIVSTTSFSIDLSEAVEASLVLVLSELLSLFCFAYFSFWVPSVSPLPCISDCNIRVYLCGLHCFSARCFSAVRNASVSKAVCIACPIDAGRERWTADRISRSRRLFIKWSLANLLRDSSGMPE